MIRPEGFRGAAFSQATDGDASQARVRAELASRLEVGSQWADARQVHGRAVIEATVPGRVGEADGLFTQVVGLPVFVRTADCVPVILEGENSAAVVHAGWRGMAAGVIWAARQAMQAAGAPPVRAAIGPSIGPCCYGVGSEVLSQFPEFLVRTRSGAAGIDLWSAAAAQTEGLLQWSAQLCTQCEPGFFSHRAGRAGRQVAVAWVPDAERASA